MVQERVQPLIEKRLATHEDGIELSIIIPCKDNNDLKLSNLLQSIYAQDFLKSIYEIIVVDEGTSESAKAIGIKKAKGKIICIMASDNLLPIYISKRFFNEIWNWFALQPDVVCAYPAYYGYKSNWNSLNRYFALIGGNDPLSFYLGKNDKLPWYKMDGQRIFDIIAIFDEVPTLGDNMFFMRKATYEKYSDLDNFYHIDAVQDVLNGMDKGVFKALRYHAPAVFHDTTDGNIFSFFKKRYSYGLQHAFNSNRRWHLVDFNKPRDIWKLLLFIFYTLTLLQPLCLSLRGYLKIRDRAWFLHPVVCVMTLFTYALLVLSLPIRRLKSQLSSVPMDARRA